MNRKAVNQNVPPKVARIRAVLGWICVAVAALGGIYWLSKL